MYKPYLNFTNYIRLSWQIIIIIIILVQEHGIHHFSFFFSILYFETGQLLTQYLVVSLFLIFLMIMFRLFHLGEQNHKINVKSFSAYHISKHMELLCISTGYNNFDHLGKVVSTRFENLIQDWLILGHKFDVLYVLWNKILITGPLKWLLGCLVVSWLSLTLDFGLDHYLRVVRLRLTSSLFWAWSLPKILSLPLAFLLPLLMLPHSL